MLDRLARIFLPEGARRDGESRRQAVRLVVFALTMLFWVPVYATVYAAMNAPASAVIIALAGPVVVFDLILFRATNRRSLCANILVATAWSVYTAAGYFQGGSGSPPTWWYATIPVLAITLAGLRAGFYWSVASIGTITAFYLADVWHVPLPLELSAHGYAFLEFASGLGLTLCLYALTWAFHRIESRSRELLSLALVEAQAADRAKSEFLANMSHEIRTPMTAILGYTDLIVDNNLEGAAVRDALAVVKRNGEHLVAVINDILDLSRIDAGRMDVHVESCNVRQIVEDVTELMRPHAASKSVALAVEFSTPIPPWLATDATRLRQILLNLLGNAVKFTDQGEVHVACAWEELRGGPRLRCEIRDSGIGIPADKLARLFQPFSQADTSLTRRYGGTGLGLAISRRLAQLLGGDVTVISEPGRGSTFTLVIPAAPSEAPQLSDSTLTQPTSRAASAANGNSPKETLKGLRVLLAEDSLDNQRLIGQILKRAGACVDLASNGEHAFERAMAAQEESKPYDVVLMDMQMPVMDGYTATRQLRRWGYRGPIIALTAHSMEPDRQKCLDAGCDDYDTKPIDRKRLLTVIQRNAPRLVEVGEGV